MLKIFNSKQKLFKLNNIIVMHQKCIILMKYYNNNIISNYPLKPVEIIHNAQQVKLRDKYFSLCEYFCERLKHVIIDKSNK